MSQFDEKARQLFRERLLNDEDIYWIGEPVRGKWRLNRRDVIFWVFTMLMVFPPVILLIAIYTVLVFTSVAEINNSIIALIVITFLISATMNIFRSRIVGDLTVSDYFAMKPYRWWQSTFYVMTTQRVLINEQGRIRDYWFHLLDEPILKKSKNGTADILLYSNSVEAKQKIETPLDIFRDISLEEADNVIAIFQQIQNEQAQKVNHLPKGDLHQKVKHL